MDDGEIAVLTADAIDVFDDETGCLWKSTTATVDWDVSAAEKGGYPHFMLKEIMEQPEAIRKTVSPRIQDGRVVLDDLHLTEEYVREHLPDLHHCLRLLLPCGHGQQVQLGAADAPAGGSDAWPSEFRYCDPAGG